MQSLTAGNVTLGNGELFLIAGPCVIETPESCYQIALSLKRICLELKLPLIFKASFDKANRSSGHSYRGVSINEGLELFRRIKAELQLPVTTDVHEIDQTGPLSSVVDILQIPAFLCRQTDLLIAAGKTGAIVNVKKGQFLAPQQMQNVAKKIEETGNRKIMFTERGTTFGYELLVNDMRALPIMRSFGYPVVFDGTHSVQRPGGLGNRTGGDREFVPTLTQAAVAAGVDGIFLETHPDPDRALSDGPNMIPLDQLPDLLKRLQKIHAAVR